MSETGVTRIFDDRGFAIRNWISTAILVVAIIWGIIELVRAAKGMSDQTGYLFGAGFIAAAAYGGYRMLAEARDAIIRFDVDFGSGQSVATLWRPWGLQRLTVPLDALSGWRLYVSMRTRSQRSFLLRVNHPANPRPLYFDLKPGITKIDGLRRLAPEAIVDFERDSGGKRRAKAG